MKLTTQSKEAILNCFDNVTWISGNGQTYINALRNALYPPSSISAVYTQSGIVYNTADIEDLRADLVVSVNYESGESETVTGYTLSGTLQVGTSTITVSYLGLTTTFNVTVTEDMSAKNYLDDAVKIFEGYYMAVNPTYHFYQLTANSTQNVYVIPITAGTYRLLVGDTNQYNSPNMGSSRLQDANVNFLSICANDMSNATTGRTTDQSITAPTSATYTAAAKEGNVWPKYIDITWGINGYIALSLATGRGDWSLKRLA